ncbi:NAD(P)H-dependent oxidoreductase [Thalassomonas viridans]|uniref:FMN dependent NADH:quinone oxidoreductase n=1 Tax=Thalassomonas viridans TaxID=137584 RepID=A0AAF0CC21_9GAMM|nr:NAD(P)H-dependent oxidoreductase [Thalassomonas viridans]WDE07801.1 NAD(P)H-dependent oxidoreductase [Thalassomonas viridans]
MTTQTTAQKVLIIKSSPAGEHSISNEIAAYLQQQLSGSEQNYTFTIRDLAQTPPPVLDGPMLQAFYTPAEQLTHAQQQLVQPSLELIQELKDADILIFASAMHNFSITSLLKSYVDQICRMGLTFSYSENGPQGLLTGKQAVIIASAGMDFQQEHAVPMDFQSPYLKHILNFIGITDISLVPVQGVAMGDESAARAKNGARDNIDSLIVGKLALEV